MAGVVVLGVLGPLLLEGEAGPVRIGSGRQRRLLAALTAHLGRTVEVDRLVDLVWADDVPADPAGAVQTNVARLRRLLPAGIRVATTPEGYRLEADRAAVAPLIEPALPTVAIVPDDDLLEKNRAALEEIKARSGRILAVAHQEQPKADQTLLVPKNEDELDPILMGIPLQLLAYHTALALGRDIDKPRNLAKSVTVE